MEILRTPDHRFAHLTDYPYAAHYTNVKTHDGANLRIQHIDEGPQRRAYFVVYVWLAIVKLCVLKNDSASGKDRHPSDCTRPAGVW